MKITITKPIDFEVKYLLVQVPDYVNWEDWRYNNDESENGAGHPWFDPKTDGITFKINVDEGTVVGWKEGDTAEVFSKVRDEGLYHLMDQNNNVLYSMEEGSYVPDVLDTYSDGYGDYIQFKVRPDGKIENWNKAKIYSMIEERYD